MVFPVLRRSSGRGAGNGVAPGPNQRHDSGHGDAALSAGEAVPGGAGFAVKGRSAAATWWPVPAAGANGGRAEREVGPTARRHRRAEADLHPRAAAAGRGPAGGRRRDLAGGARLGRRRPQGARARARPAGAQMLPAARLRPARRVRPRAGGGDRGAAAVEAAQGGAPAARRRTPAPAGRPAAGGSASSRSRPPPAAQAWRWPPSPQPGPPARRRTAGAGRRPRASLAPDAPDPAAQRLRLVARVGAGCRG